MYVTVGSLWGASEPWTRQSNAGNYRRRQVRAEVFAWLPMKDTIPDMATPEYRFVKIQGITSSCLNNIPFKMVIDFWKTCFNTFYLRDLSNFLSIKIKPTWLLLILVWNVVKTEPSAQGLVNWHLKCECFVTIKVEQVTFQPSLQHVVTNMAC